MLATESPFPFYADSDGLPLDQGAIFFGAVSQDPVSVPIPVFWDVDGLIPAAQPIRTMNGYTVRNGTPALVYVSSDYSLSVKNRRGERLYYAANSAAFGNSSAVAQDLAQLTSDLANAASQTKGDALLAVKRTLTGAIATTQHAWHEGQPINAVSDFGLSAAGTAAANTTAMNLAVAAAAAIGSGVVQIPAGSYALTAGTNFASPGVSIIGLGRVTLDYSGGTGIAFKLDAGGSGALVQRMRIENLLIKGGPNITEAFYARGITRSLFRNIETKHSTQSGFSIRWGVLNTYDHCIVSDDTGAQTPRPANYWYIDDDGLIGNHTQACVFLNCEASGIGAGATETGFFLKNAILNTFVGGTSESTGIGIDISDHVCRQNAWYGFDLEDNRSRDIRVKGYNNAFYNSFAQSTLVVDNVSISEGVNTLLCGGYYRHVALGVLSSDTVFQGVTFDDSPAFALSTSQSFRRYGCITNTGGIGGTKVSTLRDVLGPTVPTTISVSQNNTPTQTANANEAVVTGHICHARGSFSVTSAGTAGNSIAISLDTTFPAKAAAVGMPVGDFVLTQAGTQYTGACILSTPTTMVLIVNNSTSNLGINPALTLASGATLTFSVDYPIE